MVERERERSSVRERERSNMRERKRKVNSVREN
jgi:hypothetical protein